MLGGCVSLPSGNVIINAQPPSATAPVVGPITHPTCTVLTGSVDLSGLPVNGTWILTRTPGNVTTSWSGGSFTLSGIPPGSYTYTVTNEGGCISPASGSVIINAAPAVPTAPSIGTITSATCLAPGSVVLNNLPASGSWTLTQLPGGTTYTNTGTSYTVSGLGAGSYTFTVTNSLGCTSVPSSSAIVTVTGAPAAPTVSLTHPTCAVGTGTITITAPTGVGMTYSIDGVTYTNTTGIFTLLAPNTYPVTARNAGGCISPFTIATILAQPVTPTAPTIGAVTQPTCALATGSLVLNDLPATGTLRISQNGVLIPAGSITGSGTSRTITGRTVGGPYTYTVFILGIGCISPQSAPVTFVAATNPAIYNVGSSATSYCADLTGVNITLSGSQAGVNYQLRVGGVNNGPPIPGTGSSLTWTDKPAGVYTVVATNATTLCTSNMSGSVTITVVPVNTITLSSAPGTDAQSVCINSPITDITYSTFGATGATFSGLPTGVTGNWAANVVTISGSPSTTVGSPFSYTVNLTGGCGTVTETGSITVTPANTITLSSGAGTDAQTVCISSPITNITYTTTGATGATFSGLPTGVTGNWAANVVTISGSPSTTVGSPFNYTVNLTGGCGTVTATGSITVTPANTIALSSVAGTDGQTVCISSPITNITYITTGATGATFSGLPTGVTGNWAANVVTISGSPSTTVGSPFSYTVNLTGGCGTVTETGSITVTPANTITLSSVAGTDGQTVCISSPITNITYTTTGATGATFSGLPTGVTGNWAANVVTISGSPQQQSEVLLATPLILPVAAVLLLQQGL
ncbi:MAG: hypothetical protein IPJ37_02825 [Bacteroidales bacterium]|nr:hypothetical protein [Bacteroidales bacterium]